MTLFKRATKAQARLRMALAGPAGAGKTYTALQIATFLADGGPVACVDTEHGSASKYAGLFAFDVLELSSYHPERYIEAIRGAEEAAYDRSPRQHGNRIAVIRLVDAPRHEPMTQMPDSDYAAEGWEWLYRHPEYLPNRLFGERCTREDFSRSALQ